MFNDSDLAKELINAQSQPVEYIVFSGGGAKGNHIYTACIQALGELKILPAIKSVAGSSAGAMIATMVAFGVDGRQAEEAMSSVTPIEYRKDSLREKLRFRHHTEQIKAEVDEVYQLMTELINHTVSKYLASLDQDKMAEINVAAEIGVLQEKLKKGDNINFADLSLLNQLDGQKFKLLHITAVKKLTGELVFFDQNTPFITIEEAYRASSALPFVLEPVLINGEFYIDGGYRDNTPINIFQTESGRSLIFLFGAANDKNDPAYKAVDSEKGTIFVPNKLSQFEANFLVKKILGIGGDFVYYQDHEAVYQIIREHMQDVIILDTGIGTADFAVADLKANILQATGYLATMRWFQNHYGSEDCAFVDGLEEKEFILAICNHIFSQMLHNPDGFKVDDIVNIDQLAKKYLEPDWRSSTMVYFIDELKTMDHLAELIEILQQTSTPHQIIKQFSEKFLSSNGEEGNTVLGLNSLINYKEQLKKLIKQPVFKQLMKEAGEENIIAHVSGVAENNFFYLTDAEKLAYLNRLVKIGQTDEEENITELTMSDILVADALYRASLDETSLGRDDNEEKTEIAGEVKTSYNCNLM